MAVKKYSQVVGICSPRTMNAYGYGKEMNLLAKRHGFGKHLAINKAISVKIVS